MLKGRPEFLRPSRGGSSKPLSEGITWKRYFAPGTSCESGWKGVLSQSVLRESANLSILV